MELDPTRRFSVRVDAYARYRPSYPREVTAMLARECGLRAGQRVADIGCGTGLLAQLFLEYGCEVFGVEPNPEMREAGRKILAGDDRFHSVEGRAEATTLEDGSVDFVTAGQAFHWFEPETARTEFRRILKPEGWVVLVWNERNRQDGFMVEYESLIEQYAPEKSRIHKDGIGRFFGDAQWKLAEFSNHQELDREGLRGRLESSSYAPLPGTAESHALMAQLDRLFERYQKDGRIAIVYDTHVFYGSWRVR